MSNKTKKIQEPMVSVNLSLFKSIRDADRELQEARNSKLFLFMSDDGERLILNALGKLYLDAFRPTLPKDRGEGNKENPNFNRRNWTVGMIYDQLPSDWKKVVKDSDLRTKLLTIWKDQGGKLMKGTSGDEMPDFSSDKSEGWLTSERGQGRAGIVWGLDTSKLPDEVTGEEEVPEEK